MTGLAIIIGLISSVLLLAAGYLFGARVGVDARDALRREVTSGTTMESAAANQELSRLVREAVQTARDPSEGAPTFAGLKGAFKRRSDLPALLAAVADEASLTALVLSDESGLPVSQAGSDPRMETWAATSSVLLNFIDRLSAAEMPHPVAVVVHDTEHQRLLYRIFDVGGDRFVLTAVARGQRIEPSTLDGALGRIEALLREALA